VVGFGISIIESSGSITTELVGGQRVEKLIFQSAHLYQNVKILIWKRLFPFHSSIDQSTPSLSCSDLCIWFGMMYLPHYSADVEFLQYFF
jgi:hypothetical protein